MPEYHIGIAVNAFKGSMTALEAGQALAHGFLESRLNCRLHMMPLADGGDGTLTVMLSQPNAGRQTLTVQNPLGEPIKSTYGIIGRSVVIEMALASGLALIESRLDAMRASTYGTGELIRHAIQHGATRIVVGVGGSATVDGGAGCLQALGVHLLDKNGDPIPPGGAGLRELVYVEPNPMLEDIDIQVLCDVDNPILGEHGAAAVFAPQKGASPEQVEILEENLSHFFTVIADTTGRDVFDLSGGGAAGALAGGLAALADATLVPGAETLIDVLEYDAKIRHCHLVVTGEGKLDEQTEHGKAPAVIAAHAARYNIPTIGIAGSIPVAIHHSEIKAMFSLMPEPATLEDAMQNGEAWLTNTAYNLGNLLAAVVPDD